MSASERLTIPFDFTADLAGDAVVQSVDSHEFIAIPPTPATRSLTLSTPEIDTDNAKKVNVNISMPADAVAGERWQAVALVVSSESAQLRLALDVVVV